jgi:hypothetical protein
MTRRTTRADVLLISQVRTGLTSGQVQQELAAAKLKPADIADRVGVTPGAVRLWLALQREPTAEHAILLGRLLADVRPAAAA